MDEATEAEHRGGLAPTDGLHRAILASALDPMVVIDPMGAIVLASDSVERVFGYPRDDLVGRNIRELMPEPHRSAHDSYLENYRRTGETNILNRTRLFTVVRRDGSTIECELSVARVELGADREPLFIGSFRDVSDRLEAERAARDIEQRLQAVFDRAFEYMGLLDAEGRLLAVNDAALNATGKRRDAVIGKPFWAIRWWKESEAEREQFRGEVERAGRGEFVRFEITHPGSDGEQRTVDFSISPVRDESGAVVLLVPEGRDITALKRAQSAENAMLRSLAEIGESAAILAHEIKNPITSINTALRAVADQLGADHREVLEDLASRMQRLERVMRRTLSFTRPVELERRFCCPRDVVEGVEHELRPAAEASGIELQLELPDGPAPSEFHADPQLVGEVLTNLVSNALEARADERPAEAGEPGRRGVIRISLDYGPRGVSYVVDDDGPGVPASERKLLFKPFHTTKSTGAGLGLALCRKIAHAHGGSLAMTDSALGGAAFRLELPWQGNPS